jgi:hypothetical protein
LPEKTAFTADLRVRKSRENGLKRSLKPGYKNERRIEKMQDYGTTLFAFIAYS